MQTFKKELLEGKHNFSSGSGHTFKIALFTSSASLGASTTDYSTSNEITNTSGSAYTAGGKALTNNGVQAHLELQQHLLTLQMLNLHQQVLQLTEL